MELANREEIESKYINEFNKVLERQRKELSRLMGTPPDFRRVPKSFWRDVDRETAAILILMLNDVYRLNAMQHGLPDGLAAQLGNRFALDQGNRIAREFAQNSLARAMEIQIVTASNGDSWTQATAKGAVNRIFGPDRGKGLIVTEFTGASVSGGESAMKALGKTSATDLWITHPSRSRSGVCKHCAPLHMTTRRLWERIYPKGPPVHPHCCCEIKY